MNKLVAFLKDVRVELARVSWPSKQDTIKYSMAVILASLLMAVFLGGLDYVFALGLNKILIK